MSKSKVTAPLSYDPGKGRPKEYLAYLNWQEMQELMRINGNNMERGPRGLPSFPPDDSIGSGQTPGTGNWTGSPGSGTTSSGAGSTTGGGSDSGSIGGSVSGTSTSTTSTTSTAGSQQASNDTEAQQAAAEQSAAEAARNEALRQDAVRGGIASINVGPMQNPVQIGGGQIFGSIAGMAQQTSVTPPTPTARPSNLMSPDYRAQVAEGIMGVSERLGINPIDLGTAISYETAGTYNPLKEGPTTKWGTHRGLIQFGEPQAEQFGVDWSNPVESQLKPGGAVESYLKNAGVKPGMGMLDVYSAINAGQVGRYGASDEAAGGAPGTVAEKVANQMSGHRQKAQSLLSDYVATSAPPTQQASAIGVSDPAASAVLSGIARLPSALSNFKIPAIPEPNFVEKMARMGFQRSDPEGFQKQVNAAMADATSGFSLGDTVAGAFGAMNEAMNRPQTAVAQNEIETVEEDYRDPFMNAASTPQKYKLMADAQVYPKNVDPSILKTIEDQEKKNRIGIKVIERAPMIGGPASLVEGIQKIFTGKDIADYGTDLKYKYMQSDEAQKAELRAKYPDIRRFAVSIGEIAPNTGNQYAHSGGTPTQEPGGKGNYFSSPGYSSTFGSNLGPEETGPTAAMETGRPQQYYLWDLGVGIPEPGDPDYNDYQKYLRESRSSATV